VSSPQTEQPRKASTDARCELRANPHSQSGLSGERGKEETVKTETIGILGMIDHTCIGDVGMALSRVPGVTIEDVALGSCTIRCATPDVVEAACEAVEAIGFVATVLRLGASATGPPQVFGELDFDEFEFDDTPTPPWGPAPLASVTDSELHALADGASRITSLSVVREERR
jgi:hypothetical protein